MKSIKKRISLLLCAVMALSLLTSCSGQGEETTPSSSETESTSNALTGIVTEATTEPTTEPTEYLRVESFQLEMTPGRITYVTMSYDAQDNLIIDDQQTFLKGTDILTSKCYKVYQPDGQVLEDLYEEYNSDGSPRGVHHHQRYDLNGTLLEDSIDYYDDETGECWSYRHAVYDPVHNQWHIDSEGNGRSAHGVFTTNCPTGGDHLIEGTFQEIHLDTGTIIQDCLANSDGTGWDYEYHDDGTPFQMEERTFDAATNTLKNCRIVYVGDGSVWYHHDYEHSFDTYGNVIKQISSDYNDASTDLLNYKQVCEYQYDTNGDMSWSYMESYDAFDDAWTVSSEIFFQKYGSALLPVKVIYHTDYGYVSTEEYEFNDQGQMVTMHSHSLKPDGSFHENYHRYKYNSRGLVVEICHSEDFTGNVEVLEHITTYEYDDQNRVVKECYYYTPTDYDETTYTYNEQGWLLQEHYISSSNDKITNYSYDADGVCTQVEVTEFNEHNVYKPDEKGFIYGYASWDQLYPLEDSHPAHPDWNPLPDYTTYLANHLIQGLPNVMK